MGIKHHLKDDGGGFALGSGDAGITVPANEAMSEMINLVRVRSEFVTVRINVFGFSRGATTARYFMSKLKGKKSCKTGG